MAPFPRRISDMEECRPAIVVERVCAGSWRLDFADAQMPLIVPLGAGIALVVSALAELWRLREMPRARSP